MPNISELDKIDVDETELPFGKSAMYGSMTLAERRRFWWLSKVVGPILDTKYDGASIAKRIHYLLSSNNGVTSSIDLVPPYDGEPGVFRNSGLTGTSEGLSTYFAPYYEQVIPIMELWNKISDDNEIYRLYPKTFHYVTFGFAHPFTDINGRVQRFILKLHGGDNIDVCGDREFWAEMSRLKRWITLCTYNDQVEDRSLLRWKSHVVRAGLASTEILRVDPIERAKRSGDWLTTLFHKGKISDELTNYWVQLESLVREKR